MAFYLPKVLLPSMLPVLLVLRSGTAQDVQQFGHICAQNNSNSAFKKNVFGFLDSIASVPTQGGYLKNTVGTSPDQVYGYAMCYADAVRTYCTDCLNSAPYQITGDCPDSKVTSFWFSGQCFIRYSNESFFSLVDTSYNNFQYNINNFPDLELFRIARSTLFDKLIAKINASENLIAFGEENVTTYGTIYGLLQCNRDLNHQDCNRCLNAYIQNLTQPSYFSDSQGIRFYGLSCYLHYETNISVVSAQEGLIPSALSPASVTAPGTAEKLQNKSNTTIILLVVGSVSTLILILIAIWSTKRWFRLHRARMLIEELQEVVASEFLIFDLTTIRNATDNFSDTNMLGRGGFGPVFKGILLNGQEVAVKRLSTSSTHGAKQFKTEVELLVRIRHKNLVKLLGCCISEKERMLCYEYLPNGSLDNVLFGTEDMKCKELYWSRRFRIIKGTCRGLLYLHEESPLKIVHRDLKASNILLDRDMNPKIADFGLARLFDRDQTHTTTAHVAGTYGYIAPECSTRGRCSVISDTYSFGILLLEIVSGRRNNSFPGSMYTSGLIRYVWKHWSEGKVLELKDPTLDEECIEEVTKCIHIALLCLQENPSYRPNMETVANMLSSSSIASLPPLPHPKFIWGTGISIYEDDESVAANLSLEYTVVGVETANASFLSSFNRRA